MKITTFRITPGQDLKFEIVEKCRKKKIKAGIILTCVGSLRKVKIRLADDLKILETDEKFEIVSLVGTLSGKKTHIHISLSDKNGRVIGGHLKEGCIVHTTAEVVIGNLPNQVFDRKLDKNTGFEELVVKES